MVKHNKVREVIEDAVVGKDCCKHEHSYGMGYDSFQFPFTVSFDSEGKYEVVIKGKQAVVQKAE
jgi:hypothetical protein